MLLQADPSAPPSLDGALTVIVVNDFAAITGGSDRVALAEAAGLARRGHRVTLIAGHGEPEGELVEAGVAVRSTRQHSTLADPNRLRAASRGVWNRRAAALVAEVAAVADPRTTVVHIHGFTKVLSASVVRAAVDAGIPTVATLHDYFVSCPNGGFFNYQSDEICRLTPLSPRCIATNCDMRAYSHKLWRLARLAVQRSAGAMPSGVSHLIVPSRFAGAIVAPFLPAARLHVLPNPVPGRQMAAVDASQNGAFAFVGRLGRDKGPVLFARAARQAQVPAVFVGSGEEAESIRRANPTAELTGWLSPDRVHAVIRQARAVVNASLWYETQGLSPLEAAAHGVPAIVSDVGVLREVVDDDETGLWFHGGDVDDLAEKLAALWRDPQRARRLGDAAYQRFWSGGWDLPTHLERLEGIYAAALNA
jgi:glycosyltransferase involved in cell wall biosynthesis